MKFKFIGRLAALAALVALGSCDKGPQIEPARFNQSPTFEDVAAVYPDFARIARIPGRVKMRCEYTLDGDLKRCRMLGVAPEGLNFDKAVPRLLGKYNVIPQTLDGRPAPAPLVFTINFEPAATPGPYAGPAPTDRELAAARRSLSMYGQYENNMLQHAASRTVPLDRMSAVAGMVDRAYQAEGAARRQTMAAAMVMALTPADRRLLAERDGYLGLAAPWLLERLSPEFHAANERMAARIRTEYCAAYSCDLTLTEAVE